MPSITPNMGFTLPYESDKWNPEVYNENFRKIDAVPYVVESGVTSAYHSNINATIAQYKKIDWYYKKWSDGTLEAYAVAHISGLACNDKQNQDGTWRSGYIRFYYPSLGQQLIYNRGAFVSQADNVNTHVWVADVSQPGDGADNATYESVRCISTMQESIANASDKNFYLSFKGTWK